MGKKARKPSGGAADLSEVDSAQVTQLKEEGNGAFVRKEYQKALESYDKALKIVADSQDDKALLLCNKAACNLMLKRYDDSVSDCTAALEVQPGFSKALQRRAKAFEQLGKLKEALSDIQKVNKGEQSTTETQETEKRLKDLVAGKKLVGNGVNKKMGRAAKPPMMFAQAKCNLNGEVRNVNLSNNMTYAELLDAVHKKFPACGPVLLQYLDKDGGVVTIKDKSDIQAGLTAVLEQQGSKGPLSAVLPPLRITVTPVPTEEDVPQPSAQEQRMWEQLERARQALQDSKNSQQPQQKEQEVYELDEWLVEFAELFREHLGVESGKQLELHKLGYEKCMKALDGAVTSEKAAPLFGKAADRFQEVALNGLLNWGNVFMCVARKLMDEVSSNGGDVAAVEGQVEAEFKKAEERYNQSLHFKADYYDSFVALGQLYGERAKLLARFTLPPPKVSSEEGVDPKEAEKAALEAQRVATEAVLKRLTAEDVAKGESWFEQALSMFARALEALPAEEKEKEMKPLPSGKEGEEEVSLKAHTLVIWGNLLYEMSQIRAAVGGEWRALLEEAVDKFKSAGCSTNDIRGALLNHSKKDEMDIPEPEPEVVPAPATADAPPAPATPEKTAQTTEAVKGLPALPTPKAKAPQAEAVKGLPPLPAPAGGDA